GSGTWPSLVAYFGRMMQTATMPAAQRFPQLRASLFLFPLLLGSALHAQDDLVRVTSATATDSTGYRFTTVVSAEVTPVENQASSGTCWSYAANSFLESEMIKNGGPAIPLSKIYTARRSYEEKADTYVRMHEIGRAHV